MNLTIRHETHYRYTEPATRVTQALRLWPAESASQVVLEWRVVVDGVRLPSVTRDGFSNPVATHTVNGTVDEVNVEVHGRVQTADHHGVVRGTIELLPLPFFLYETPLTHIDASIRELAGKVGTDGGDIDRLHRLCNIVRNHLDYIPGQTDAETTASQALRLGAGVCQDHAHLLSAAARVLGFPARYVSGYLSAGAESGDAASHAWAEIHVAELGWVGFDAANRICPNEHYVRIASGRDYRDAAPVRGLQLGGKSESLEVSVDIGESPSDDKVPWSRRHGARQQ